MENLRDEIEAAFDNLFGDSDTLVVAEDSNPSKPNGTAPTVSDQVGDLFDDMFG